jgi:magnesium transporter
MTDQVGIPDFNSPVVDHARKDFPLLDADMKVGEALERIRREGVGERVIYFYTVDEKKRLVGVVAVPATATVLDACEFFVLYKFFAFPIIDENRRVVGVIDVGLFAEEVLQAGDRETQKPSVPVGDDVFEALGFHLEQVRGASPWRGFHYRFRWLLVTVTAGTLCAILAGFFEATLAKSLVIAFFLTMVLGLNESVSAQSMSVTIQALRAAPVTWGWFAAALRREFLTALLIGLSCGALVGAIVWVWRKDVPGALVIGGSIVISLVSACLVGLCVPSLLHRFKLDPKIAAGPVTLALADTFALVIYFTSAWLVLR